MIDTARCSDGGAEELVGEALAARRDEAFLVDKVLPSDASRHGTVEACDGPAPARTDRIDLYLRTGAAGTRWRRPSRRSSSARRREDPPWGVSNLDVDDLAELDEVPSGDQVENI